MPKAGSPGDPRARIEALARKTESWTPGPAVDPDLRFRPFPLDALPSVLRCYIAEAAAALGCDPAMVALPVLASCAGAIGYTRAVSPKPDWIEPLPTWTVVVSESGTMKSPAHDKAVEPIRAVQAEIFEAHKEEMLAYEEALEQGGEDEKPKKPDDPPIVVVSDTTIEKLICTLDDNARGVLQEMDELHGWFRSFTRYKGDKGGTDAPYWLSFHRAGPVRYDRKTGSKTLVHVAHAAVSVCGTIQPGILRAAPSTATFSPPAWGRGCYLQCLQTAKRSGRRHRLARRRGGGTARS